MKTILLSNLQSGERARLEQYWSWFALVSLLASVSFRVLIVMGYVCMCGGKLGGSGIL